MTHSGHPFETLDNRNLLQALSECLIVQERDECTAVMLLLCGVIGCARVGLVELLCPLWIIS